MEGNPDSNRISRNLITSCPAQDVKAMLVICERVANTDPTHVLPLLRVILF